MKQLSAFSFPLSAAARTVAARGRVEPWTGAIAGDAQGVLAPAIAPENLHHLRQADDAGEKRYLVSPEPVRIPAAIPVLVLEWIESATRLESPIIWAI